MTLKERDMSCVDDAELEFYLSLTPPPINKVLACV